MSMLMFSDSCDVKNGGCHKDASCSHDSVTNEVKCTCKTGFTDISNGSSVVCEGKLTSHTHLACVLIQISIHIFDTFSFQTVAKLKMVAVIQLQIVLTIQQPMQLFVLARLVMSIQDLHQNQSAKVK